MRSEWSPLERTVVGARHLRLAAVSRTPDQRVDPSYLRRFVLPVQPAALATQEGLMFGVGA